MYGYNIIKDTVDWDFFIGSDIDGTAVATSDNKLIVTIEKQYIKGAGGTLKLDPNKKPEQALEWFFPTLDTLYNGWLGGIIGSASINDSYVCNITDSIFNNDSTMHLDSTPNIAAFTAIDGNLYVVNHKKTLTDSLILSFDSITKTKTPELLFKKDIGPSISTPIIVNNRILACGYNGIFLFEHSKYMKFKQLASKPYETESTPVCYKGKIYIASRNGYLYCLGRKN